MIIECRLSVWDFGVSLGLCSIICDDEVSLGMTKFPCWELQVSLLGVMKCPGSDNPSGT